MDTSTHFRQDAPQRLATVAEQLAAHRSASLAGLVADDLEHVAALGVQIADGRARLDDDIELLAAPRIRSGLDAQASAWLRELDVRPSIDSTNTALLAQASARRIDGCILTAEMQSAGRGRRGREWLSPFGRNLAVSFGIETRRPPAELGTLSLVVGLAVRAALEDYGLVGVELKWPNDVLLHGRKVAGILIELVRPTAPVEVVVGIGVNVGCHAAIASKVAQAVADVAEQIAQPSRNALLALLVNRLVATIRRFEEAGFEPFRQQWQEAHRYQGETVTVTLPAAAGHIAGRALGIGADGALRIDTGNGVREFNAGEVSVREG